MFQRVKSKNLLSLLWDDNKESQMRTLFVTLSIVIGFIGLTFIVRGGIHPNKYEITLAETKSAAQVTQIYTEATYTITVGIGIISAAVLTAVIGILLQTTNRPLDPDTQSIEDPEAWKIEFYC